MVQAGLDSIPLLAILFTTIAVVLIAIEIGFRVGCYQMRRSPNKLQVEGEAQLGAMTGAHLALLAFIMGFSFNMAAGHYQERRSLVMQEANAISTAYSRSSLLSGPEITAIRSILTEYTGMRAKPAGHNFDIGDVKHAEALQLQIWSQIESLTQTQSPNVLHSLLIQSINEVFDVQDRRLSAGMKNRVPHSLWDILVALLILSMLGIGYFCGVRGKRNTASSTGLALSFSLVLFLIADLDRPSSGLVVTDNFALQQQYERMLAPK